MKILGHLITPKYWSGKARKNKWLKPIYFLVLSLYYLLGFLKKNPAARKAAINIGIIFSVIWGALLFADWVQPSLTSKDLFTPPVVGPQAVKAVLAKQGDFRRFATYTGRVFPFERVILRARVDGFVSDVLVYPGDIVHKGQVVVHQETSEILPRFEKARADLLFLEAEFKRDEKLYRSGAISASDFELSRNRMEVATAKFSLLETEVGYATVEALTDGVISRRAVDPGQYVSKGDHLLAYDRLEQVRVRFDVALQDLTGISVGNDVILEFPEIPKEALKVWGGAGDEGQDYSSATIRAKITSVFPSADETSLLGVVEAVIQNPDLFLKSNTYVIGHIETGRAENAWIVPEKALVPMPGGKTVIFIAPAFSDQGAVEMREVEIGVRNGEDVQIIQGLDEMAYVVTAGNRSLTDGETVTVVAREGGF